MTENQRLKEEVAAKRDKSVSSQVQDCDGCDQWHQEHLHLDIMFSRRDLLIANFIQHPGKEETKKMFKESKAWSKIHLKTSPLNL